MMTPNQIDANPMPFARLIGIVFAAASPDEARADADRTAICTQTQMVP